MVWRLVLQSHPELMQVRRILWGENNVVVDPVRFAHRLLHQARRKTIRGAVGDDDEIGGVGFKGRAREFDLMWLGDYFQRES